MSDRQLKIVKPEPEPLKMRLQFIPPEMVRRVYPMIEKGMAEVLAKTRGEIDMPEIMRRMEAGRLLLSLVLLDKGVKEDITGYVLGEIMEPMPGRTEFYCAHVWRHPQSPIGTLERIGELVEEAARAIGCKALCFVSALRQNRAGQDFEQRVAALGFKPHYVEYHKEL